MKRIYSLLFFSLFLITFLFAKDAFALAAGTYSLRIQPTPITGTGTAAAPQWWDYNESTAGNGWNSSFSFNVLPGSNSQKMIDNPEVWETRHMTGTGPTGADPNIFGDQLAGKIVITVVSDGSFIVNSFQLDVIDATAGGNFNQYGLTENMSGQITGNDIFFDPRGRVGSISGFDVHFNKNWNIDSVTTDFPPADGVDDWIPLTTGTTTLGRDVTNDGVPDNLEGNPIWTDSTGRVWATLVSGGAVGSAWGGFFGTPYLEVWRVEIVVENPCDFADCDDANPCTDDLCTVVSNVAVCSNPNNTASCSDGTYCTVGDTCSGGTCVSGTAANCNDNIACTDDTCNPAIGCVNAWNGDTSCLGTPTVTPVPGGEMVFWDWNFTGPGTGGCGKGDPGCTDYRGYDDYAPINGFGGPNNHDYGIPDNPLDPTGGMGQIQHVITQDPDWDTPDALNNLWGDLFDVSTYFPDSNVDGTVNFYKSGYTTVGGSVFDPMYIDYDGDYLVPQSAMNFMFYDVFDYRDAAGNRYDLSPNPNPYDSLADFQPFPISDGIGWCGSALANHPVAMEPMAGQITFTIVMEAYFPFHDLGENGLPDPGEGQTQIIPNFRMGSYGTLEVKIKESLGGVANLYYRADAVVNNTSPILGRDATHPMGFTNPSDPKYYNHVSFMGGDVVPPGVWLNNDGYIGTSNNHLITLHPVQGPNGTYNGEIRADGAYWHENAFDGFPFLLRADGIRYPDYFDAERYGADTDDDGVQDDANRNGDAILDNCINVPNGPKAGRQDAGGNVQRDSNNDGYGNLCDADLNNDGNTNSLDLGLFKAAYMTTSADPDLNGDGTVNALDLGLFKGLFMNAPGPSGRMP